MKRVLMFVTLTAALAALGACSDEDGLVGPAAMEEPAASLFLPVERVAAADGSLVYVQGLLLITDKDLVCNHLIGYVDEGLASETYTELLTGRHLLGTLRRAPSFDWQGLYAGATSETLAQDDVESDRLSTGLVYFDGEEILSEEGGFVYIQEYGEAQTTGELDFGVVEGAFDAEVCDAIERDDEG